MNDKASKGANADAQEHGENQDQCANRQNSL